MPSDEQIPEIELDKDNLYREETISDRRAGSIRRLVPVTPDGKDDSARDVRYEGYTTLMTPAGSLPIHFELEADGLAQALALFPEAAKNAIEQTVQELNELRRQSSSSLYVPGLGGSGGQGGFGGAGGSGGPGGGIQL